MNQPYDMSNLITSLEDVISTGQYEGYSLGEVLMYCNCFDFLKTIKSPLLLANEAVEEMRRMFPEQFPEEPDDYDSPEYANYINFESLLGSIQHTVESVIYHRWFSYKDDDEAMNDPLVSYGIYNGYIDLDDDEEYEILMNNQYEEDYWCRRYGNYRGSYAQDEMGYSDDDIDTIFDGDPSAYWNID